ncbi:unnamed protein product [Medioppia subpectinata]|uniref:Uncharacterized protein n=1 Tax=Medioppia subpectinata TaxID=1979941 RepID=A0A7R9PT26_9ACAR|nr:unnamed protein product [Medioppia subpectinata]CAG2100229.1 unnamed protein product [Medioppia subpectinata]
MAIYTEADNVLKLWDSLGFANSEQLLITQIRKIVKRLKRLQRTERSVGLQSCHALSFNVCQICHNCQTLLPALTHRYTPTIHSMNSQCKRKSSPTEPCTEGSTIR